MVRTPGFHPGNRSSTLLGDVFMHKPYKMPVVGALPDIKIPESQISLFYMFILRILVRPYIITLFGLAKVVQRGEKELLTRYPSVIFTYGYEIARWGGVIYRRNQELVDLETAYINSVNDVYSIG